MSIQDYALGVALVPVALEFSGQRTATQTAVARFQLPFKARLVGASASARATGGTSPTLDVDVRDDGVSMLSAAMSITAGAVTEGAIANPEIADESEITVDFTITGSSPTWDDMTLFLLFARV